MLNSVEILACELTDARSNAFIQPALFNPPRIEAACILAGHPTRTGKEAKISSEIAPALPKPSRVEIQPLLTYERAKIDVHRGAESVPARESLFLHALEIPQR